MEIDDVASQANVNRDRYSVMLGLCGLVTSVATAVILWWVSTNFGFAFYTWMLWFVVPVGALLSGFAGASGYLFGAWLLGQRPTKMLLLNIVLASIATFFTIHFLDYATLEIDGKAVSDYVPFLQYLDIQTTSSSMTFRFHGASVGDTGELGNLGYGIAFLQVLGFACGGFAVFGYLSGLPYCNRCSRYLRIKGKQVRYTGDGEALLENEAKVIELVRGGELATALAKKSSFGEAQYEKGKHLRSTSEVRHCKKCGQHWMKFDVSKRAGDDWKEIPELTFSGFTETAIDI